MATLTLSIPVQDKALARKVETRPKQVRAWIEALPLTHALEAGRQIAEQLTAQNRVKLEPDDRRDMLDAQLPTLNVLFDELDALYASGNLPLSEKARKAVDLAKLVRAEVANAYKILIAERTSKLFSFGGKKSMPPLLFGAFLHLAEAIKASYRSYTPAPAGVWLEMYRIYLFALAEGYANEPMEEQKISLHDLMIETCLLAVIDPYRASVEDIDRVGKVARSYKGLATLHTEKRETDAGCHFLVPCDTDRPPRALDPNIADPGGPNARLMDTSALVATLKDKREKLEAGQAHQTQGFNSPVAQAALFGRLITLWGDPPKRAYRRDPADTQVAICYGIKAVAHFIGLEPELNVAAESEAIKAGITIPLISLPNDEVSRSYTVHEWEVVNQSAGGLKVKRNGMIDTPLTVGEVIGIKFIAKVRWQVGVIRWVSMAEDGAVEFGVQMLSPHAHAVLVRPTVGNANATRPREGLWLPEIAAANQAERLITPLNLFSDLREYEVSSLHQAFLVRATQLNERTSRFEMFEFQHSEEAAA